MEFDFDPAKSAANLKKHGIDFADALWSDPDRLEVPARSIDEPRTQAIGDRRFGVVGVHHAPRRPDSHHLRQASTR